jgi:hypothetical protein
VTTRIFVSGVTSATHLVHVAAYVRHVLASTDDDVCVVVLGVVPFLGRRRVEDDDVRALLPVDPRLRVTAAAGPADWHGHGGERLVYVAVGAPGVKPLARLVRANTGRRLLRVVIDEGIGSYGTWRTRWAAGRREGRPAGWALVRAVSVSSSRHWLAQEVWSLHREHEGGWVVDERIAAEFRRHLSRPAGLPARGDAVLLSQPWVELGVVDGARYVAVVDRLRAACADAGLRLRVRTHPAEDPARYVGHEVEAGRGPAELDASVTDAGVVLGMNSTALVNIAALYGTPVVRVAVPELAALDSGLSRRQRSLLTAYLDPPVQPGDLATVIATVARPA